MRIMYNNLLTSSTTISASSNEVATPKSNLYDGYLSNFLLFTGKTSEYIIIDAGSGNTFDVNGVGIAGHNFTSSATIKIQGNATNVWTSPSYDDTITYREGVITHFATSTQQYRYFRLSLADSTNTANLQIGYLFIGEYVQFPGISPDININHTQVGSRNITRTGQISGTKDYSYRSIAFNIPNMTNTQRQTIVNVAQSLYNSGVMFCTVWESSQDFEPPIYGVIDNSTVSIRRLSGTLKRFATSFTIREAK